MPDGTETIGYGAFSGAGRITAVNIPDSVKTISEEAFCGNNIDIGCKSLCRITFGNGLETVSSDAFDGIYFLADGEELYVGQLENLNGKTFCLCNGTLDTGYEPEIPIEGHALVDVEKTDKVKAHQHCTACEKNFIDGKEVSDEDLEISDSNNTLMIAVGIIAVIFILGCVYVFYRMRSKAN